MARIMIDYEVNDETLWNNVLDLLLSFKQVITFVTLSVCDPES